MVVLRAIDILALITIVTLVVWMRVGGGAGSQLWEWLPPFWPLGSTCRSVFARWLIVILLILGTMLGMLSEHGIL
jgi:hypothetical protein